MRNPNHPNHTTRINTKPHSAFNLLKRVGFALLFLAELNGNVCAQDLDSLWSRQFGGEFRDYPSDCHVLMSGNVVTCGFSELELFGEYHPYLVTVDELGDLLWEIHIDSLIYGNSVFTDELSDGSIIVGVSLPVNAEYGEFRLYAFSPTGSYLWSESYSTGNLIEMTCGATDPIGNIFLVGREIPETDIPENVLVIKTNSQGEEIWRNSYDLQADLDWPLGATADHAGGLVISGYSVGGPVGRDGFYLRVNGSGDSLTTAFSRIVGLDQYSSIRRIGHNYLVSASHPDLNGIGASALLLDSTGQQIWRTAFGSGIGDEEGTDALQIADGRIVMSGYTRSFGFNTPDYSNLAIWILSSLGDSLDMHYYGGELAERGIALDYSIQRGTCYVAGRNSSAPASQNADYWLLRLDSPTSVVHDPVAPIGENFALSAFPNPFNSTTTLRLNLPIGARKVTLTVSNILGQQVEHREIEVLAPQIEIQLSADNWPSGIYLARAEALNKSQTTKLVLLK